MRYQEYKPPRELQRWVKLFWVFESQTYEPLPETLVADGYPELVVHFGSTFTEVSTDGLLIRQPNAIACGQLTHPLILHGTSNAGMIGIRFQPSGMAPFISSAMQSLTDARVPATELFQNVDQLTDEVLDSANDSQRLAACVRFLLSSLSIERENDSIRRTLDMISRSNGKLTVDSLTALTGRSRRSLELAFKKEVGTSPKMYCRIVRFRRLYDTISECRDANWVSTALDCGFFDQSHLIRDFRRFSGSSPTQFLKRSTPFSLLVNQT